MEVWSLKKSVIHNRCFHTRRNEVGMFYFFFDIPDIGRGEP